MKERLTLFRLCLRGMEQWVIGPACDGGKEEKNDWEERGEEGRIRDFSPAKGFRADSHTLPLSAKSFLTKQGC